MSITTKRGDGGQTDLLGGLRVSKADPRIACCGDADELCAALGLAKSLSRQEDVRDSIEAIQRALFTLGTELAGGDSAKGLTPADVAYLEGIVDCAGTWSGFVLPGADPASAALHLARTVCRRLEREMVVAQAAGHPCRSILFSYVNRLSDALYALASVEESAAQSCDSRGRSEAREVK